MDLAEVSALLDVRVRTAFDQLRYRALPLMEMTIMVSGGFTYIFLVLTKP